MQKKIKMATKVSTSKKSTAKTATKTTTKKTATKPAAKKSVAKKASVKKEKVTKTTPKKATKPAAKKTAKVDVLKGILAKVEKAKKKGETSVVVYTTKASDHNKSVSGFGAENLKPEVLNAYKHIFCNFNVSTRLVSMTEKKVEWVVNL